MPEQSEYGGPSFGGPSSGIDGRSALDKAIANILAGYGVHGLDQQAPFSNPGLLNAKDFSRFDHNPFDLNWSPRIGEWGQGVNPFSDLGVNIPNAYAWGNQFDTNPFGPPQGLGTTPNQYGSFRDNYMSGKHQL